MRKELDLTDDLDDVYKMLNALAHRRRRGVRRPRQQDGARRAEVERREGRAEAHLRLRQRAGRSGQGGPARRRRRPGEEGRRHREHDLLRRGQQRRGDGLVQVRGHQRRAIHEHRHEPGRDAGRREDRVRRADRQARRRAEQDLRRLRQGRQGRRRRTRSPRTRTPPTWPGAPGAGIANSVSRAESKAGALYRNAPGTSWTG